MVMFPRNLKSVFVTSFTCVQTASDARMVFENGGWLTVLSQDKNVGS